MDQSTASRLGRAIADFYASETTVQGVREVVLSAMFSLLYEFVPDEAVAAMIQREGDNVPLIAAVKGDKLYTVEYVGGSESGQSAASRCTLTHLAPDSGTATIETRYHRGQTGSDLPPRSAVWTFGLGTDTKLTIQTFVGEDGEVDDRERLAHALALALGWDAERLKSPVAV